MIGLVSLWPVLAHSSLRIAPCHVLFWWGPERAPDPIIAIAIGIAIAIEQWRVESDFSIPIPKAIAIATERLNLSVTTLPEP